MDSVSLEGFVQGREGRGVLKSIVSSRQFVTALRLCDVGGGAFQGDLLLEMTSASLLVLLKGRGKCVYCLENGMYVLV